MPTSIPISKTKIVVPHRRPELLTRTRLLENLNAALEHKLILLSAPAGFGKTSLLVDLAHHTQMPVCWLALDELDRDPQRFIAYLSASLAERFPGLKRPIQPLLNELKSIETDAESLLVALTNELYEQVEEDFIFILDDFHLLDNLPVISAILNRFLQLVDENCHVIISSRSIPALPDITLMLAREQVEGLNQADLAFQAREIQALFNQNQNQHLSEQEASQLAEQSGGWITGLILSDLSGGPRVVGGDAFTYLGRQVLDQQPPELRAFLLRTSLPEEFNAELCESILSPLYSEHQNWPAIINRILEKNLFILPLGDDGKWLRYHPLFREFLRTRLKEERPQEIRGLLERLTQAYEASGEWEKAYFTCQQIEDPEMLATVVEHAGTPMLQHALTTLENWVNSLPPNLLRTRPGLISLRGGIAITKGNIQEALLLLDDAEAMHRQANDNIRLTLTLARRATAYRLLGNYQRSLQDADEALKLAEPNPEMQAIYAEALRIKGTNLYRLGKSQQAIEYLEHSLALYTALKEAGSIPILLTETGIIYQVIGEVESAKTYYQRALKIWQEENNYHSQAEILNSFAVLYHQVGDYEMAAEAFEKGLALARKSRYQRAEALTLIGLGDLYTEVEDYESALQAYDSAEPLTVQLAGSFIDTYLTLAKANLAVIQGNSEEALHILRNARQKLKNNQSNYEQGLQVLIEGRIYLLKKQFEKAIGLLQKCREAFTQDGRSLEAHSCRIWLAAALCQADKIELAQEEIKELFNLRGTPPHALIVTIRQAFPWLKRLQKDPQIGRGLSGLFEKARRLDSKLPDIRRALRRSAQSVQVPAASLIIKAFGHAEVRVEGRVLTLSDWSTQSVRDLFFYFLYKKKATTKEQIASALWPELDDLQVIKQRFKTYLFRLRRATRRDAIVFEDEYYRFNYGLDYEYDVEVFETQLARAHMARANEERIEHYQKAIDLASDPYLAEVDYPWALGERERLGQMYLNASEDLAKLFLSINRPEQVISVGQRALERDPYRETTYQLMMRAYSNLGDRNAVTRQYTTCKDNLKELGLVPSPETETLYQELNI